MKDFQHEVSRWTKACFGEAISSDVVERNHRFLEEAFELVQACGITKAEAYQLCDYVFNREVGDPFQEVGGVANTLAALCNAWRIDLNEAAATEMARVWVKAPAIRAKQANKPKFGPLAEGENQASEFEYLQWFYAHADFGPADGDVRCYLNEEFQQETGKELPVGYETEEE